MCREVVWTVAWSYCSEFQLFSGDASGQAGARGAGGAGGQAGGAGRGGRGRGGRGVHDRVPGVHLGVHLGV